MISTHGSSGVALADSSLPPLRMRLVVSPTEQHHTSCSTSQSPLGSMRSGSVSRADGSDSCGGETGQAQARRYTDNSNSSDSKRVGPCEEQSQQQQQEVEEQTYPGGVVAGSHIPAGVSLGLWPHEAAWLGADLLQRSHTGGRDGHTEAWTSGGSCRRRLEVIWRDGQAECRGQSAQGEMTSLPSADAWLTYIRSARDRHDQNAELCRKGAGLQVRTLRVIDKGEALLVWYGEELAREVGVPILTPANIRGYNSYACTACLAMFSHPNTLKAHVLLRCPDSKVKDTSKATQGPRQLVPFDSLLRDLHKCSKSAARVTPEHCKEVTSRKITTESPRPKERTCTRCSSTEEWGGACKECPKRKREESSKHSPAKLRKDSKRASQRGGSPWGNNSTFRKPCTPRDGVTGVSVDTWPSPTSTSSLSMSVSESHPPSPPRGDDSVTMSPDSSTDQGCSALNLSVKIPSREQPAVAVPILEPLSLDLRRFPAVHPSYPSPSQWSRALVANSFLAQTFASLPFHAITSRTAADGCVSELSNFGQPAVLSSLPYHRHPLQQQCQQPPGISIPFKHLTFPARSKHKMRFQSNFHPYPPHHHFLPLGAIEEVKLHQHRQNYRLHHHHHHLQHHQHRQQQIQQQQQQQQQQQEQHRDPSPLSPPSCETSPSLGTSGSSPKLPSPLSCLVVHQHQPAQAPPPRGSASGIYGLTLPADKEPLDLLPQTYFANKSKKGHLCLYCGKVYSRKYGLKIHMRTHNGYKPLKCKICSRPFGDPSNLNKHVRLHAQGETPYRCDFCGKVLVRRRDLDRHIKSRHPQGGRRAEVTHETRDNTIGDDEEEEEGEEETAMDETGSVIDVSGVDEELSGSSSERMPHACDSLSFTGAV